ncbi:lysophospholipid acyltransferase LPCAT4-like isoform X2 [Archocentrus centrarchus]|nr:lysophospholipid acyltransferase LPCAT4-like isoform X2 [Archocentrus centrarchus]
MLIAWFAAWLRIVGLSEEERSKPLKGWRLWFFHSILWLLGRAVFFCVGFHWVKVKGRKADVKEAPIMVVAPHSSYLDMVIMFPGQVPSVVSRSENKNLPVIGALLECSQSIMVSRKDPNSRKRVVSEVSQRVTSNGYWPQMLMFPEGTTTNGRCLLKFKHGAFVPGVPVQPVVLHYPNELDTVRWTYKGSNWIQVLLYTLSQLYTNITVEFLPVYTPSEVEKKDPNLFANNVQKLMARALGVPASDYVMVGRWPVRKLADLYVPLESPARETVTLLYKKGLGADEIEAALDLMIERCLSGAKNTKVSAEELASILGLTDRNTAVHICGLYSKDKMVDLRCIYFNVAALTGHVDVNSLLHFAFIVFDTESKGSLSKKELTALMGALLGVPQDSTEELYRTAADEGELTEENLLHVLTTNTTYQKVTKEYLQPEPIISVANGTPVNTRHLLNGSIERSKSK